GSEDSYEKRKYLHRFSGCSPLERHRHGGPAPCGFRRYRHTVRRNDSGSAGRLLYAESAHDSRGSPFSHDLRGSSSEPGKRNICEKNIYTLFKKDPSCPSAFRNNIRGYRAGRYRRRILSGYAVTGIPQYPERQKLGAYVVSVRTGRSVPGGASSADPDKTRFPTSSGIRSDPGIYLQQPYSLWRTAYRLQPEFYLSFFRDLSAVFRFRILSAEIYKNNSAAFRRRGSRDGRIPDRGYGIPENLPCVL